MDADGSITKITAGDLTLGGATAIRLGGDVLGTTDFDAADTITFEDNVTADGDTQRFDAGDGALWAKGTITKTTAGDLALGGDADIDLDGTVDVDDGSLTIEDDFSAAADLIASENVTFEGSVVNATLDGGTLATPVNQNITAENGKVYASGWIHKTGDGNLNIFGGYDGGIGSSPPYNYSIFTHDVTVDNGQLDITGDAYVVLAGDIYSSGNMQLTSGNGGWGYLAHTYGTIESLNGSVEMTANDFVILLQGGNATEYVTAGEDILLNDNTEVRVMEGRKLDAGDDVILAAGKSLQANDSLTIVAGDDILLGVDDDTNPGVGTAGDVTATGDLTLNAGDDIYAHGELISDEGSIELYSSNYTTYLYADVTADDSVLLNNETELRGTGTQRIEATTGTLTANRDVDKTTEGNLELAGATGIVLGDDVSTENGHLIFENDVTANGTGSRRNQLFDADRWSDSYENDLVALGSITKTTSGRLTLDGGSGDSKIYVAGDVSTSWGSLIFEDDVIAIGEGDQTFTAGPFSGYQPLSRLKVYGSVTKEDGGDIGIDGDGGSLTLESGWQLDVDGDITVDDGTLTVEADQHIYVGGNILAKGDILIRADKDLDADAHQGDPLYGGDVDVEGDITSTQGSIDVYSTDFTTYLGGDVDAAYDVTLHNSTILDGEGDQTVEAGILGDGTLTAGSWMWKTTEGNLYLIGNNDDSEHRDGKAIDLQYAGCLPAASTSLGNLEISAENGDIQISGDLTTFGMSEEEPDICEWYDRPTGGVLILAENGKIYTDGASPENDTLNIGIVGNSDDITWRDDGIGPLGVEIPGYDAKLAIAVLSSEDLKFGPDTMLIAKGRYDSSIVDDRQSSDDVSILREDGQIIGGYERDEGDAIDAAVVLASGGDVHLDGRAIDVETGGTMIVAARETVSFGDFDTFNMEGFEGCEDLACFLIKLAMRFHEDIDFGDLYEAIQAYEWDDGLTDKENLENFLNDYFEKGFFFNIDRLEVVSKATEWLFQATGRLPYANDPAALAAFEAFIGGDYILRGAGLGNSAITDGRAWVLENPPVAEPLDVQYSPQVSGCPAAMGAVANELAIAEETLQISIGNMLALNPTIQPCNACAGLLNAAAILRDEDGARMAALIQVFNEQAPANVPFSPAMATSIVTAFADQMDDGSQSHYATAMDYIDAFVQYVAILDTGLGSPVEDSTAFVMAKYGAGITESENSNIAAFVAARLA
ncbi:MAG: autotransporter outer membrane beta-barrel domain-containing protein, partial [Planctomycetota bacterium]